MSKAKEVPILFSGDMVMAILEGRKTQTRRIVKPQSKKACGFYVTHRKSDGVFTGVYDYDENEKMFDNSHKEPYQIGQILWVRETWQESECFDFSVKGKYAYLANDFEYELSQEYQIKWRPSIHMPRVAARLFLRVTNVRIERLQDITPDDCEAEGMDAWIDNGVHDPGDAMYLQFKNLWDRLNLKRGYGWDTNPWVWVIEFERVGGPDV